MKRVLNGLMPERKHSGRGTVSIYREAHAPWRATGGHRGRFRCVKTKMSSSWAVDLPVCQWHVARHVGLNTLLIETTTVPGA